MPIYFQSVKEVSASKSGIMLLPVLVGLLITLVLSGPAISIVGYYTPFMLATSVLMPIGAGLMTTFAVDASLGSLISFQALLGLGAGIGLQAPQVAAQTVLSLKDVPMGISAIMFAQGFAPALIVPIAQNVFTSRLTADLSMYAQGLNATVLETMGLSDLKAHVGAANLQGALLGYDKAVTQTFYLPVALTSVMILGSLGMEWRSVKEKRSLNIMTFVYCTQHYRLFPPKASFRRTTFVRRSERGPYSASPALFAPRNTPASPALPSVSSAPPSLPRHPYKSAALPQQCLPLCLALS